MVGHTMVVVTVVDSDELHATAYVLSQADRVEAIAAEQFVFGAYRTFQRPVSEIAERTDHPFGGNPGIRPELR